MSIVDEAARILPRERAARQRLQFTLAAARRAYEADKAVILAADPELVAARIKGPHAVYVARCDEAWDVYGAESRAERVS